MRRGTAINLMVAGSVNHGHTRYNTSHSEYDRLRTRYVADKTTVFDYYMQAL